MMLIHTVSNFTAINSVVIWYGNWSDSSAGVETMEYLAHHISDSKWYSTMRDYYFQESKESEKKFVTGTVHFKKSYYDNYSQGNEIDISNLETIIRAQLNGESPDPNGAYFVFGSSDIKESESSKNNACGYHTYTTNLADYPTYFSYIYVNLSN